MSYTIPNMLTLLRIGLIPLLIVVYFSSIPYAMPIAAIIFTIAGLTDLLDGYLARKLNQTSAFGAFLDPVADKLIVTCALVIVVYKHPSMHVLIPALIIIGREITVSALREWMAELGNRAKVSVSYLGKIKTTVQIIAIIFLLWHQPFIGIPTFEVGQWLLDIAAVLTVISMIDYLRAAFRSD
ncbi:MAG: CDP-diacylglycerol--glycerol-3-phosphate 3-phosphatidyltransferase [Gammaproteobacteria bacterium]|nr:CDP-diacylglycerol--glycerol-3-phosphate 3-phosphatidyltransferase [Gammaproteobacteria bacterium]